MANIFSNFFDIFTDTDTAWDDFKNGKTNSTNKNIADQNLQFQRENLEYQKALQQQIFDREDSAYARTVADMRSAGLSPLMMSGTNGAGEAIATQPLHNDFQMQDSGLANFILPALQSASAIQEIKKQSLENEAIELENKYNSKTLDERVSKTVAEKILAQIDAMNKEDARKVNEYFGVTENMPEKVRITAVASKLATGDNSNAPAPIKPLVDTSDDVLGKSEDYDSSDPYDSVISKIPVLGWIFRKSRDYSRKLRNQEKSKYKK